MDINSFYRRTLNEEGSGPGISFQGGTGTLSDIGATPIVGVKKDKSKKNIPAKKKGRIFPQIKVNEAVEDFEEDSVQTEEEGKNIGSDALQDSPEETEYDRTEDGTAYGDEEIEDARNILDSDQENLNPSEEGEGGEEDSPKKPKVPMSVLMKYRVNRVIKNRNHSPNTFGKDAVENMSLNIYRESIKKSFTDRIFSEAISAERGQLKKNENDPLSNGMVLGEISRRGDRYMFAARTNVDNSNRDFIFEGDYEKMKALLIVLRAELKDPAGGKANEIMEKSRTRVDPVRVLVGMESLLTDGVKYAQQVITK